MRISEAKQGEVVFAGDQAYKIIEKITSGVIVKNVETSAVFLVTEDVEVVSAEDKVQTVLNKFIYKVGEALLKNWGVSKTRVMRTATMTKKMPMKTKMRNMTRKMLTKNSTTSASKK